jgi:trigger factor
VKAVVEPLEGNKVKLSVEVDEQEFEKAVDAAFRKIAREVRIPGFRPGKAPRRILQARIGLDVARQEALRESLPEYYAEALRQTDVDPISPPEIDITTGHDEGPVAFDAVVEVRPQATIPGYQGLRVVLPSPLPTDEEVDQGIDRLREQGGELRPVSRPAKAGDHVSIDLKGERDGEAVPGLSVDDYLYEVGSGTLASELDEQLRGAKVGDILAFEASLDDGPPVSFRVLVKDLKEKILPEVTDEWASEASEFETVEELREDVRKRLGIIKRVQVSMALRDEAVRALAELVREDVPEALVTQETERRWNDVGRRLDAQGSSVEEYVQSTGTTVDELVMKLREDATDSVKADLALRALADAEDLEATEAEVQEEIERAAHRLGEEPTMVRRRLEEQDAIPQVRSDVRKAKALEWLVEHIEVVDEEGRPIDRGDLSPEAPAPAAAAEVLGEEGEEQEQ